MSRPLAGTMVFWRYKKSAPGPWLFGYVTYIDNRDLIRMGNWNGDSQGGNVVSVSEIEHKPYSTL